MDPALHYGIYGEGIDEQAVTRYDEPVKPYELHHSVTNYGPSSNVPSGE